MSDLLHRRAGLTLWRQIGSAIENDIRAGRVPVGQPLPTERELAKRFTVARQTIRRAMADLEQQGIISIQQGRGTADHFLSARQTDTLQRQSFGFRL